MEKDEFKIVSAEVTSNEAESASNTVKDLKRVRKLRGSMAIRLMILTRFIILVLLFLLGKTLLLGVVILLGVRLCASSRSWVMNVGGMRRVMVIGGWLNPCSQRLSVLLVSLLGLRVLLVKLLRLSSSFGLMLGLCTWPTLLLVELRALRSRSSIVNYLGEILFSIENIFLLYHSIEIY